MCWWAIVCIIIFTTHVLSFIRSGFIPLLVGTIMYVGMRALGKDCTNGNLLVITNHVLLCIKHIYLPNKCSSSPSSGHT